MDETGVLVPVDRAAARTTAARKLSRVARWLVTHALRRPWTPYVWLAVLLGVVVWPAWTNTQQLAVGGDVMLIHYPWFVLWRQMLAAGQWPWWNTYTLGGLPAFATLQAGYGYPPHWLLSWMPAIQAVNWMVGLHIVLAGLRTAPALSDLLDTR